MDTKSPIAARSAKEVLETLKPFATENRGRSWWEVASTLIPMAAFLAGAAVLAWWPLRLLCSIAGGLVMVRGFILFHDFMHGAILRDSRLARVLMYGLGALLLTPPRSWRESHNYHHAHVGRIGAVGDDTAPVVTTDIGAFPIMNLEMWRRATATERFRYRLSRHPVTIFCAYLSVFMVSICLGSFFRNVRKHWPSGLVFLAHGGLLAGLWLLGGWQMMFFACLLPIWIAAAAGALLFYAQHSFPGVRVFAPDEWSFFRASMETASYLKTGRVLEWITGCIGYHHIHHLNSGIPFYRLREAMEAIPELQHPTTIRLRSSDLIGCFQANLWDPTRYRMVSYRFAAVFP